MEWVDTVISCLNDNKEWLFSGMGIIIISGIVKALYNRCFVRGPKEKSHVNQLDCGNNNTENEAQNSGYPPLQREYPYSIDEKKEIIKKNSAFPWFHSNLTYQMAYQKLFICPTLKQDEKSIVSFEHLKSRTKENLVITGIAGSGKSMLLKYFFAFLNHDGYECIYLSAKDIEHGGKPWDFMEFRRWHNIPNDKPVLFCIDDIDETYSDNVEKYFNLITRINNTSNCHFWLACRLAFYKRYSGYRTNFGETELEICPWDESQYDTFIRKYASIVNMPDLPNRIEKLVSIDPGISQLKTNPFQLVLLSFLAEESDERPVQGAYDLYERFLNRWFKHEEDHGTCHDKRNAIMATLEEAAKKIYDGNDYLFDDVAENNTAISELLVTNGENVIGKPIAKSFYHRSLAVFLVAYHVVNAMQSGNTEGLREALHYKLKDDVTNFIGAKYMYLKDDEKVQISQTLQNLYDESPQTDETLVVREQAIYFLTRLEVDADSFLEKIIAQYPEERVMRLTLAYGCVLTDNDVLREFALEYAKSLFNDGEDAVTNRAWTVVYFGDVINEDPYTYDDRKKGDWSKARQARIKRFTRENPRLKDYRFRLFDIPLFYSFLKSREWDGLSKEELLILENVDFPEDKFNANERAFLEKVRGELVDEYKLRLEQPDDRLSHSRCVRHA